MGNFLRIRCLVPTSVMIEDLSVRLVGKGAEATVMTSAAEASHDLRDRLNARQVALLHVGPEMWPFAGPVVLPPLSPRTPVSGPPAPAVTHAVSSSPRLPPPSAPPPGPSPDVLSVLSSIDQSLKVLLQRPSPPPADVVAAHVRAISGQVSVAPQVVAHPQFIPSTILPSGEGAGSDIKVRKSETSVGVDESVSALKELRGKKK